jgi:hypothetical protein
VRTTEASAIWGNLLTGRKTYLLRTFVVDAKVPVSILSVCRNERESTGRTSATREVGGMKYILSACPIHRGCTIQVVFGKESDERIPFPNPALKQIAERDFAGLVPIEEKHLKRDVVYSSTSI